jgi:hypothetical protein
MTDMDIDPTSEAYDKLDFSPDSSGRHRFMNRRTKVMLDIVNQNLGFDLVVIQGSFMLPDEVADQSEHTHDGGGVIDLRTRDIPSHIGTPRAVRALREIGFAAFHRTDPPFDEDHIHAVAIGDVQMDPSAKDQVDQYLHDGDGLGGKDTGPKVDPIPIFDYDTQGLDMQLTDKIPGTDEKTVGDALRAALRTEDDLERLKEAEARRAQQRAQRNQRISDRIASVGQAVDDLPEGATKQQIKNLLEQMLMDAEPDDTDATP